LPVRTVSRFPDFLIVGAPKCGTTSLFQYLGQHPQIYPSPEKEPHFYSYVGEERPHWGTDSVEEYTALFEEAGPEQLCVEASTWYLYSSTAAEQIRRYAPDTKCVALLRQPVDRAYSSWSFRVQNGWEPLSFEEAIAAEEERIENEEAWGTHYLNGGLYSEQVRRFYEQLGRDQLRIILFDDFQNDADAIVREVLSFLGLELVEASDTDTVHNPTRIPRSKTLNHLQRVSSLRQIARQVLPESVRSVLRRKLQQWNEKPRPPLDPEVRKTLTERVWSDVEQLESLLDTDLSRWAA
jgi:hypothetical protein